MTALLSALAIGLPAAAQEPAFRSITPAVTDAPLFNPGRGVYAMVGQSAQPDPELWSLKLADIVYHRCHWADLEPERGVYRFDEYLGPMFDAWVTGAGKRVAFRVMCESMHANKRHVTPEWVFEAAVPSVTHRGLRVEDQIDPVFWDPLYLDLHCEFIQAFGEWADGRDGLEFVDIGSIGEWGEMHFGLHIPGRWTREELAETGFSETKLAMAYRRVIDTFAEAFPHTRVFLNVGGRETINDYAAMQGLHFRQDGLGPDGASYGVESRLFPRYAYSGTQCNLELIVGYQAMQDRGWDPREVIRKGLTSPISYQNINFGGPTFAETPPADVREAVEECARRIGYRLALRELTIPAETRSWPDIPGRLPIRQVWENQGVAPCYESLALEWQLRADDGQALATATHFPETPTTLWRPGEAVEAGCLMELPAALAVGRYALCVRAYLPEDPGETYALPLADAAEPGVYRVAEVSVVPGEAGAPPVLSWDFEDGETGAEAGAGIDLSVIDDPTHGGAGALRMSGVSSETWNYAKVADVPMVPGGRYRLSAWMLVSEISRPDCRPNMKVGVNDAAGDWIENYNTQGYDTAALGTWQPIAVEFDCPISGATGHVTVERGSFRETIDVGIVIDDVALALIGAP